MVFEHARSTTGSQNATVIDVPVSLDYANTMQSLHASEQQFLGIHCPWGFMS